MKKQKNYVAFGADSLLILYGSFLLCADLFSLKNFQMYMTIFFGLYGVLQIFCFCFAENKKEYSPLLSGILGILFAVFSLGSSDLKNPQNFSLVILLFALFFCLIKLKKADYFHDRKSKFWLIEITSLIFFLFLSILISMNLKFSESFFFFILGFYSFFIGVFEFYETLFFQLTKGNFK